MDVELRDGIYLPGAGIHLDPPTRKALAAISHAHSDHIQRHQRVICTAPTAALMRRRGCVGPQFEVLGYRKTLAVDEMSVTLYPAGHILGSAQVLVEARGRRILYSGDFCLRPGQTMEAAEVPQADVLIMETTYGKPAYRFPPNHETVAKIREFCRAALAAGEPPVLFCYSLGKGQELLSHLAELGMPIYLQSQHWDTTLVYREFGTTFPPHQRFQPGQKLDGVLLCTASCRRAGWFSRLGTVRTATISGWALDSGALYRFKTDAAFPLSDHADFPDLLTYARQSGAERIYTVHGFDAAFAGELRKRGFRAEPLRPPAAQLTLPFE
jgi:Cft2 family RNA processing exonuclease